MEDSVATAIRLLPLGRSLPIRRNHCLYRPPRSFLAFGVQGYPCRVFLRLSRDLQDSPRVLKKWTMSSITVSSVMKKEVLQCLGGTCMA